MLGVRTCMCFQLLLQYLRLSDFLHPAVDCCGDLLVISLEVLLRYLRPKIQAFVAGLGFCIARWGSRHWGWRHSHESTTSVLQGDGLARISDGKSGMEG